MIIEVWAEAFAHGGTITVLAIRGSDPAGSVEHVNTAREHSLNIGGWRWQYSSISVAGWAWRAPLGRITRL